MKRIHIIAAFTVIVWAGCGRTDSTTTKEGETNKMMPYATSNTPSANAPPKKSPSVSANAPLPPAAIVKCDVTGSWKLRAMIMDADGPGGLDSSQIMNLSQTESKFAGTMSQYGAVKGSIDGSNVTFTVTDSSAGNMDIVFEGNFVDTYTMKGTVHRVPGGRDGSWHAKRDMIHSAEIHKAAENGDVEQVRTLLGENPDLVFSKDDAGRTPLLAAAFNGNKDILGLLLANKANIHDTDIFGYTPLHRAASGGHKDAVELLLKNNADPDARDKYGFTPLHAAAQMGNLVVVELLLTNKADVNAKDNDGETPLHVAVARAHNDVADMLRQHGGQE